MPSSRTEQEPIDEALKRHPGLPRLIAVKIDAQRRGVSYTRKAIFQLDPERHQIFGSHIFGTRDGKTGIRPESLLLRDGTSIITTPTPEDKNPYIVDVVEGKLVLTDAGRVVEEVEFWPRPDYYAKSASTGVPMRFVIGARPKRLYLAPYRHCHFWNAKEQCLFCDMSSPKNSGDKRSLGVPLKLKPEEIAETMAEALKEPGRFTGLSITSGSNTGGKEPFDKEVDYYIEVLKAVGSTLSASRFTCELIATAFSERQLKRLHEETGVSSYTADIEVLDEKRFNWICPGKARWVGYREWKDRLAKAVGIFGPNRVSTCIVAGTELAKPHGFRSEDEALEHVLSEAEGLARNGVGVVFCVFAPRPGSTFHDQTNASFDYYANLTLGLHAIRQKYALNIDFNDYRNCGNHPDSDLARLIHDGVRR